MKKLIIFSGIVLIILNTLVGFIFTKYLPFNFLMVDVSLIITVSLIYMLSIGSLADGYKIGLTVLFSFTGLAKVICCVMAQPNIQDNIFIIIVLAIIAFEVLTYFSALYIRYFKSE